VTARPLTLNEDSTVTESTLGFTDSSLKVLLEGSLISNYSHTTTTTTHGGFDDNGEAVLRNEGFGKIVRCYRSRGTGNDGDAHLHG
jgi:hypothetical protein